MLKNNESGVLIRENKGTVSVINGLSLNDLRICIEEVVKSELEKYKNKALETALIRDREFVTSVFNKLNQLDVKIEKVQDALSSPSMQFDLVEAERGYIKTGSEYLLDILGELIAERVNCKESTIKQIVLSEAIKIASILLDKHLDILALRFLLVHANISGIRTIEQLYAALITDAIPLCSNLELISDLDIIHLDFTRCSTKSVASVSLNNLLWDSYTSAFYKPFSLHEIKGIQANGKSLFEWFPNSFVSVENGLFSFRENTFGSFEETINKRNDVPEQARESMRQFFMEHCVKAKEIKDFILEKHFDLKPIFEMWDKGICSINLSSVGIAIGAIHMKNISHAKIDLNIWIK